MTNDSFNVEPYFSESSGLADIFAIGSTDHKQSIDSQNQFISKSSTSFFNSLDNKGIYKEETFDLNEWKVFKTPIGEGSFSEVFRAYNAETKKLVAIKAVRLNKKDLANRVQFEVDIMKRLDHNNIVKLYDVIITPAKVYLILEYCSGGTLEKYIEDKAKLTERQIHHYFSHLSEALKYLRSKNVLHRDIKPHNLLINEDNELKVSDFGLSTLLDNDKLTDTVCGSPIYMAPEVIKSNIYGVKSDLWSIGIILYQLIYLKHPYTFKSMYELIGAVGGGQIVQYPKCDVSSACLDLLRGLLVVDSNKRMCWGEFFMHPWLNRTDFASKPIGIVSHGPHGSQTDLSKFMIQNYHAGWDPISASAPNRRASPMNLTPNSKVSLDNSKSTGKKKKVGQCYSVTYLPKREF
jgi:serine/threonine protein kinase